MASYTKDGLQISLPKGQTRALGLSRIRASTNSGIDMPSRQKRRHSARVPCKLVCPFELTQLGGTRTVRLLEGYGHAINRSVRGMLLLLPEPVIKRQVVEIQVPSTTKKQLGTKLVEVCWIHPIPVSARVKMYLAGTRFLFELPAPGQSSQAH